MNTGTPEPAPRASKLFDQMRERLRLKRYSLRTEPSYMQWVKRYILFDGKRHPDDRGKAEVEALLTMLALQPRIGLSRAGQGRIDDLAVEVGGEAGDEVVVELA